jgi:isovaleryl-CoA dehydrogenase
LARSDPGFTLAYLAHSILFVHNFFHTSNENQKRRYLASLLSGEMIGCMGMTEPSCGTDVLSMTTTAVKDGEHYRINGRKTFITNASEATLFLVYAQEEGRITAFVIERDFPGFSVGKKIDKMGMRASSMAELIMEDCIVPVECLLGVPGGGITSMMRNLEIERLALSAISLGIAGRCIEEMIQYSVVRTAFGKSIVEFGQIQKYIAESYAKLLAARTLVYAVAQRVNPEVRNRIDSDAAKLFAAPMAKQVADAAVQVLGGYGYCREYKVERFLRDAKLLEIGGGTLESHQKNITRDLTRNL